MLGKEIVLKKDNKIIYRSGKEGDAGRNDCWVKLLKVQSSSTYHALAFEGYSIVIANKESHERA